MPTLFSSLFSKNIVFLLSSGRLGNQFFQFLYFKSRSLNSYFVTFGFNEYKQLFITDKILNFSIKSNFSSFFIFNFFSFLSKLRILSFISETYHDNLYKIVKKNSFFHKFYFSYGSYFQDSKILEKNEIYDQIPPLNAQLLNEANLWIQRMNLDNHRANLVFLHVRRGDYLSFPSEDFPGVLDIDWYWKAISEIQFLISNPKFIVFSDDLTFITNNFGRHDNFYINDGDSGMATALMSICRHGILSPSSFSLMGAFLSRMPDSTINQHFIAPLYWFGHRQEIWQPSGIKLSWIKYIS
jgi:hypothetical protein